MVFTVQVFTLLRNQGAFQICQKGPKVLRIDASVSVRFAAGKFRVVCAFPEPLPVKGTSDVMVDSTIRDIEKRLHEALDLLEEVKEAV